MTKNHPNGANRAIGYARVSTSEQAEEGISLQVQEDSIRAYAQLHGLELTDILSDRGESGKDLDREAAQELLARVRTGEVQALIVYRLDRLTRSPRDLFLIVDDELNPRGVELISVSEQIDTRTPGGRAMMGIMGIFAQMERELIAERTREALAAKKRNGERLGASPLGFVTPAPGADLQPELAELEAVRTILRHRRSGKSYYGIARMMNRNEVPTKSGGRWHAGTVRNVWKRRVSYREVLGS